MTNKPETLQGVIDDLKNNLEIGVMHDDADIQEIIDRLETVEMPKCPCEKLRISEADRFGLLGYATTLYEENQAKRAEIVQALESHQKGKGDRVNSYRMGVNDALDLAIQIVTEALGSNG